MSLVIPFILNTLVLLPGVLSGLLLHHASRHERRKELLLLRQLELHSLVPSLEYLYIPTFMRARAVFTAVALWFALFLAAAHYLVSMKIFKVALIMSGWALFAVGAKASGNGGLRSVQYQLFVAVWKLFYLSFLIPRLLLFGHRVAMYP